MADGHNLSIGGGNDGSSTTRLTWVIILVTVVGLTVAACGDMEANAPQADKKAAAGGQRAQVNLPPFPPVPRGAENPRLRVPGAPMLYEDFLAFVVTDAAAKWQMAFEEANIPYSDLDFVPYDLSVRSPCAKGDQESGPFYCTDGTSGCTLPVHHFYTSAQVDTGQFACVRLARNRLVYAGL